MAKVIGIDVGTQGTKGLLVDQEGRQLGSHFHPSSLYRPAPGIVEEDPEEQYRAVCQVIRGCLEKSGMDSADIAGIAIAGQMAGVIGIDKQGRNVTPYDSWLDTRCSPYIEEMRTLAGESILRNAGCPPSFNHGPKIIWWKRERPEAFKEIRSFVQPGAYVGMRLCGLDATAAFIDQTYLHFTSFADNAEGRWNEMLCERFDLDPALLPQIVEPHQVIGQINSTGARDSGLKVGTPVLAGCGDTAASFLACGATAEGICVDVAGTASVFAATTSSFRPDIDHSILACGRSATPDLWHSYAYINGGGLNVEWFRKEIANGGKADKEAGFKLEELEHLAAEVSLENLPTFVPHLEGRVCPSEPQLRGAWLEMTRSTSLGALYRSLLEGVVLEYGLYKQAIVALYPDLKFLELRITGGGEKSFLWNQMKADLLEMSAGQVRDGGGAPLGAAMLACFGVGIFTDLPSVAGEWITMGRRFTPNGEMAAYYRERLRRYERALEAVRAMYA